MSFNLVSVEVVGDLAHLVFVTVVISIGINAGTQELMVVMAVAAAAADAAAGLGVETDINRGLCAACIMAERLKDYYSTKVLTWVQVPVVVTANACSQS
jgi:hypothetical protein